MFEIGNSLREARHRQQLDLTDVEQATKIRSRYLRALEEEAFDVLPAQTYVKGFLRTYADWLGLDGQLYVDEYNSRFGTDEEPREPVVARRTAGLQQRHARLARRGVLIALGGDRRPLRARDRGLQVQRRWRPGRRSRTSGRARPRRARKTEEEGEAGARGPRAAKVKFFVLAANGSSWMDVRNYSSNGRTLFTGTVDKARATAGRPGASGSTSAARPTSRSS